VTLWTELLGSEVRWIDAGGVRTRVLFAGEDGPAVVLLHGRGGHLESWRANVASLAACHRVVAFDLLGHGLTEGHDGGYAIADLTDHAEAVLDALDVTGALLVGQSIGGWIAARLALRRPDLASGLALIEPAGLQSDDQRLADPAVAAAYVRGGRAFQEPTLEAVRARLEGLVADPSAIDDELVETRRLLYAPAAARAVHMAVRAANNDATLLTPEALAGLSVPTLIVHGATAHTPHDVVDFAARAAGARLVTVAGARQWPQLEQPDLVNALLAEHAASLQEVSQR
jgi:2-hydroxy-6-oxonona-2,4-dienedioate hydrolase